MDRRLYFDDHDQNKSNSTEGSVVSNSLPVTNISIMLYWCTVYCMAGGLSGWGCWGSILAGAGAELGNIVCLDMAIDSYTVLMSGIGFLMVIIILLGQYTSRGMK